MESHKKILGIVYIVTAILQIFIMVLLAVFLTTIFSFAMSQADPEDVPVIEFVSSLLRYLPACVIIFISIPSLVAGVGLLTQQKWALILALVLGCLKLFSFPIGTAIGVYTIWVYAEDQRLSKQL